MNGLLLGRSNNVYNVTLAVDDTEAVIEDSRITPDTVAFFPQDWRGTCRVHETIRKVYMIP